MLVGRRHPPHYESERARQCPPQVLEVDVQASNPGCPWSPLLWTRAGRRGAGAGERGRPVGQDTHTSDYRPRFCRAPPHQTQPGGDSNEEDKEAQGDETQPRSAAPSASVPPQPWWPTQTPRKPYTTRWQRDKSSLSTSWESPAPKAEQGGAQ